MTTRTRKMASTIEHTLLKPEATPAQIDLLCDQAVQYNFAGVCMNPLFVRRAADRLARARTGQDGNGRGPVVVSVAGFPLGATKSSIKEDEAKRAIDDGAKEVDMVAAIGLLIAGDYKAVRQDIEAVAHAVHGAGTDAILKVILETAALTEEQIVQGCRCAMEGEADYVKTSTGFHAAGGATIEAVKLLYRCASPLRVKAAGGIRTAAALEAMLEAGASRIGTSSGPSIMDELSQPK